LKRNLKNSSVSSDIKFMESALKAAEKARRTGEVPVGAVIVKDGKIITEGFNKCIALNDPTAHAEIIALRKAAKKLKNYRLNDCEIYTTIEPCVMCAGALVNARIKRIIFGAFDKKAGACCSIFRIANGKKLNHKVLVRRVGSEDLSLRCSEIMKNFFMGKRKALVCKEKMGNCEK
jgi:tRNA(adenine34) deaminase